MRYAPSEENWILTQEELAARIKISTPYIGHLESGKRHPSDKIVTKLAEALDLDNRELFLLANPHAEALILGTEGSRGLVLGAVSEKRKASTHPQRLE